MIYVNGLIYDYPTQRALDNVSFNIERGAITALVGPNGAGKTTLLKCLAGLMTPVSGSILINGVDVIKNPLESKKNIGFLQDFYGLYDELTVRQSMLYFANAYKIDKDSINETIEYILLRLNLIDKSNEKIIGLSRGMRQRLAIAQVIIHNPPLLLLDEPASGLDPEARHSLAQLFLDLNSFGMTLLVSSHILAELDEYANSMIILKEGKITEAMKVERTPLITKSISFSILYDIDNLYEKIASFNGISNIQIAQHKVTLNLDGDDARLYELLKYLIDSGVPVSEFYIKKTNIQEQYLTMVKSL